MLRLQALEERIVLDAALMVESGGAEPEQSPDVVPDSAGGEPADAGSDAPSADAAAAALNLIDLFSAPAGGDAFLDTLQYTEGDGFLPVIEAAQLPVLGAGEGEASWASVALEGASSGDELVAPDSDSLVVTRAYDADTLTATIKLAASPSFLADINNTAADVETLLRNTVALVSYTNAAQDPLEGPRTLHVTLGNELHQASVSRLVSVTSVNDAPGLVASDDLNLSFTEPADSTVRAPIALFQPGAITISDVDSGQIGRASVRILDAPASADDPLGTLDRLLVDLPADGSLSSRLAFTPGPDGTIGELRLTLEGAASAETYSRLLETVRFDGLEVDPQQLSRSVRISIADVDDDGVPEEAVSVSLVRQVTVQPTNTLPLIDLVDARFDEAVDRLRPVPLLPQLQLRDPDSANQLARVVVTLDNPGRHSDDSFNVNLQGNALFSVSRVTDGTRDTYTVSPRAESGVAGVTEFNSFLATWTYANTSRANVDHDVGITVKAYDPQGAEGVASAKLVIVANPDPPSSLTLARLIVEVAEDGQLPVPTALFPFSDPDGDLMAGVSITGLPSHGSLSLEGRAVQAGDYIPVASLANLVYVPDPDYNGPDGFRYKVWDDSGADGGPGLSSTEQQASISVLPLNDAPVADNSALTVDEASIGTDLGLVAPSDVDGDSLTITVTGLPTLGRVTLADGTAISNGQVLSSAELTGLKYDAPADYNGTDSVGTFTYQVEDGQAETNSAVTGTVTFIVNPVNDAPVAVDDTLAAIEDTPVTYTAAQLLGNDLDVDGDTLTIASVTSGTGGTAVLNADGTVSFTPDPDFNGIATFTYTVSDGALGSNTATVTVNVAAVDDAPPAFDGGDSDLPVVDPPPAIDDTSSPILPAPLIDPPQPIIDNVAPTPVDEPEPVLAVFGSSDDGRQRAETTLNPAPSLEYSAPFAYELVNYELLLEPLSYPEADDGSAPERFLAIAESFEVCTLYPLLGIGCRLVPAVVEGDYLSSTGRGTLDYASAETPGVPPEPLTYDGSFVEVPAQPSDGFNAVLDEVFAHALTDSAFPGVEPGEVVLPPEGVLVPEAPAAPPTGEVPR